MQITSKLVKDEESLRKLVEVLMAQDGPIGFDIETGFVGQPFKMRATKPEANQITGFSLADNPTRGWYVPLRHAGEMNLDPVAVASIVEPLLLSGRIVAHNAKFELRCCDKPVSEGGMGVHIPFRSCTLLELYVLQNVRSYGLKAVSKEVFGYEMGELMSLFESQKGSALTAKEKAMINCHALPVTPDVIKYGVEDSAVCLALHERHFDRVSNSFIFKLEMSLLPIICRMEQVGIKYDWSMVYEEIPKIKEFEALLTEEVISQLEAETGREFVRVGKNRFNIGSPTQLGDILFRELNLPPTSKTPTGQYETGEQALNPLAAKYPVVSEILKWRSVRKARTSYLDKYPKEFSYAADGRTHPDLKQWGTFTGRFAAKDPAYHQTPSDRTFETKAGAEYKFSMRSFIVPEVGRYFLYFDLSQAELRAMAGESREASLMEAFNNDEDVHKKVASLMLRKEVDELTKADRMKGKTLNFALLYGMGTGSLARRLAVTRSEAKGLEEAYFASLPAVSSWVERARAVGSKRQYTESRFGRRHRIWEFTSEFQGIRAKAERICSNAPIQGAVADYMKIGMLRTDKALKAHGLTDTVRLIMNNHDSLMWEVDDQHNPYDLVKLLNEHVSYQVEGWPKMVADWAVGRRWSELIDLVPEHDGIPVQQIIDSAVNIKPVEDPEVVNLIPSEVKFRSKPVDQVVELSEELPSAPALFVVVETDQITREQALKLKDLLKDGSDTVSIKTDIGEVTQSNVSCPKHIWPSIRLILGPDSKVHLDETTLDLRQVLNDIEL